MDKILPSSDKMSDLDIQFRRGDIRFFLLNPTRFQDCAILWNDCFTCHISQLPGIFNHILMKWTYPDLAMFCIFVSNMTGTQTSESVKHMLRISDMDFVKHCSHYRATFLVDWFTQHVRVVLDAWPPSVTPSVTPDPIVTPPAIPGKISTGA